MKVGLRYRVIDNGAINMLAAKSTVVFYPREKDSQFKVETASVKDFSEKVRLKLPARVEDAYPGLVKHKDAFKIAVTGHGKAAYGFKLRSILRIRPSLKVRVWYLGFDLCFVGV